MYLKSIEVHGFKSFANRLVFEFHNGITGIVGPNGSGKSNVGDAVRWVLGEQSAKQLRGSSMQDVIFSGTQMRKPQSYAYVALTISNEDHKLNVPYEEVQVARRVYRSGESEYLLNGTSCRLKDVQELFFDTGIGKEGYSIIGQGQIDKILSGKPEDRRELFDEAAGIVKFKKRKATAEKNLEVESQNLLRIKDILSELEKQVGPLEQQSKKAREYLALKDKLKKYEIGLFRMDYDSLQTELKEIQQNAENTRKEREEAKLQKEKSRSKYDEVEKKIADFDSSINRKKEKVNQDKILMSNFEGEVGIAKEKIASKAQGKEYYRQRIEALEQAKKESEEELSGYESSRKEAADTLEEMQKKEADATDSLNALEAAIQEKEKALTEANEAILRSVKEASDIHTEQQKAKSMLEQNNIRKAELNQKILTNKSLLASASETIQAEEAAFKTAKKALDEEYIARKSLQAEAEKRRADIRNLQRDQQKTQENYHRQDARLATLQNIAERYDGYGQSIRRVMEQKEKHPGLIGVVADIIQVDKKYETAVETSLGGNIQNIVTEDEQTARDMIEFLKKTRAGRATFLPLTTVTPKKDRSFREEVFVEDGVLGRVSDFVQREKKYDSVIEYLLGRYLLADTIDHALKISRKYHYSLRIVTLEGELLNPGGSLSGGAFKNNSNLLGRRREMEDLKASIDALRKKMEMRKKEIADAQQEAESLIQQADDKASRLKELEIEKNTAKIKYEQAVEDRKKHEKEYRSIASDGMEIENQKHILSDSLRRIEDALKENKEKEEGAKDTVKKLTTELETDHEKQTEYSDLVNQIRLDAASFIQKNQYIAENIARIQARLEENKRERLRLEEEQSSSDDVLEQMREAIAGYEEKYKVLGEEVEKLSQEIESETSERGQLMDSQKSFFEERDALISHIGELDKEGFRLDSRKNNLEEKLESKVNYMWNEYELTYHNVQEYELDESISYTRIRANVSDTKNRIRGLGDVNVNAIEDYRSVSERYELLRTQHDDLIESEEALKKIIADLDEEMRRQFVEKFADIQRQFNKVFGELFGGGKGTLELVADEDVLEAGIIINAQPPGKKLGNMMQLSGGEKALTAIALLFAIQNLKPSPFCLLDEIEAALDDSNVKRYANYLHKLTKNTQFIVITHRKGTMEAADALYGITMQEKGVSTLVSVKLIEEQLDD